MTHPTSPYRTERLIIMQCAAVFSAGSCGDVCPPIPNPRLLTCGAAVPKVFNRSKNLYVYVTVEIMITMGTKFAALIHVHFGPALHLPFTRACRITYPPGRTRPSTKQHYISHTPASITHSTRRITRKSVLVSVCTSGGPPGFHIWAAWLRVGACAKPPYQRFGMLRSAVMLHCGPVSGPPGSLVELLLLLLAVGPATATLGVKSSGGEQGISALRYTQTAGC